jgi:hypothetical protein
MERKLVEVGHRVEAQPGCGLIPDITHTTPGRGAGRSARPRRAAPLSRPSSRGLQPRWARAHDRANQVTAYARREPVGALTVATGVGFLVGLCLAIGSHATTGGKSDRLSQLTSRRRALGRRTGLGWRRLLRLE